MLSVMLNVIVLSDIMQIFVMLIVIMLNVIMQECHFALCQYAEFYFSGCHEYHYSARHYLECRQCCYAECH
jgi:hypothetical protein